MIDVGWLMLVGLLMLNHFKPLLFGHSPTRALAMEQLIPRRHLPCAAPSLSCGYQQGTSAPSKLGEVVVCRDRSPSSLHWSSRFTNWSSRFTLGLPVPLPKDALDAICDEGDPSKSSQIVCQKSIRSSFKKFLCPKSRSIRSICHPLKHKRHVKNSVITSVADCLSTFHPPRVALPPHPVHI